MLPLVENVPHPRPLAPALLRKGGLPQPAAVYYIVSCNWRNNSTIFEPTGKIVAQIKPPQRVLVEEIDLSYMILPWSQKLKNGRALKEKYGDKVGFRYYEDEDRGFFWSNDPQLTIGDMARSIGMADWSEEHTRLEKLFLRVKAGKKSETGR